MFVPAKVIDWFTSMKTAAEINSAVSIDAIQILREELSSVRTERDALKLQNAITQSNFDWLRVQVNSLQLERAQLLEKAYGIRVPAPEIIRTSTPSKDPTLTEDIFEDIGDDMAKKFGIPSYSV